MYSPANGPLSIGGVLDQSLSLLRASIKRCLVPTVIYVVCALGLNAYILLSAGQTPVPIQTKYAWANLFMQVGARANTSGSHLISLLMLVIGVWAYSVIIVREQAVRRGQSDSLGSAAALATRRLPAALLASICYILAFAIGFVLLFVPGFYLATQLVLWPVAMFDEELNSFSSLGRSWDLVKGHWWRITAILTVLLFLMIVVWVAAGAIATAAVSVSGMSAVPAYLLLQSIAALAQLVTMPLTAAVLVEIYYDLKLRREGGDIAAKLNTLSTA